MRTLLLLIAVTLAPACAFDASGHATPPDVDAGAINGTPDAGATAPVDAAKPIRPDAGPKDGDGNGPGPHHGPH